MSMDTLERFNMLFVGNYDNGIVVPNAYEPTGQITGALAQKCRDVAPRATHYLGPNDAAILYDPLDPKFAEYFCDLYGHKPRTFTPAHVSNNFDQPLSLIRNVLADPDLLNQLRQGGRKHDWHITPFILHPLVFELSQATGLPITDINGFGYRVPNQMADLNNKEWFVRTCRQLEIPTVPGAIFARGIEQIVLEAETIYSGAQGGSVILRHSMSAGGLGNILATPDIIQKSGSADLRSYLLAKMVPAEMWEKETILVEPVLDLECSPATLVRISPEGIRLVSHSRQIVSDYSYVGSVAPSGLEQDALNTIVLMAKRFARYIQKHFSARSYCGIDWGVTKAGQIVAFECNYRYGGMVHVGAIRERLRPDYNGVISISCDSLKVSRQTTFSDIHARMEQEGLTWNHGTGQGVVIAMPPKGGSMGYVVLGDTLAEAENMNRSMRKIGAATLS